MDSQEIINKIISGENIVDVVNNFVNESRSNKVLNKFPPNTVIFPDGILWSMWDGNLAQVHGPSPFSMFIDDHNFDIDLMARVYQIRFALDFNRKKMISARGLDVVEKEITVQDSSIPWEQATFVIRQPGSFQDLLGKFGNLETFKVKIKPKDLYPAERRYVVENLKSKNYLDVSNVRPSLPQSKWKKLINMSFTKTQDLDLNQAGAADNALDRFNKGLVFPKSEEDKIWSRFNGVFKLNKKGDNLLWIVKK